MLKKCSVCKQTKDVSLFNKSNTRKDGLQTLCRECTKNKFKDYYTKNKAKHSNATKEQKSVLRASNRDTVLAFKVCGCVNCGEKDSVCLDCHHLSPDEKDMSIATLINYSPKKLKKELKKCIVLCANCHRKIHAGTIKLDGGVANSGIAPDS